MENIAGLNKIIKTIQQEKKPQSTESERNKDDYVQRIKRVLFE